MLINEGEVGFRGACSAPPQPVGCAKPTVEEQRMSPDHGLAVRS
jgi:hypothetical protein